ncbi:hypothetical protein MHLP_00165 [Candidatus Mycoplasma haematolamae str. Purdue]|uniref:Uncharacterized protein n=1 Tax=Mycoplasma haematolamae (strain Purdue) TaxID=1212765 RepID=I7BIG7_MYCHA|nr:hypothetical protein [Candidatus Mycoplasma haematolamae]AFO51613.1 hypothetical protein MHLP_00165 [Candidatus Mycoplasma haematolamae str. Purdue]
MEKNILDDPKFAVEKCYSASAGIEEKISNVLLLLNTVDGIPQMESLLNSLKLQKSNVLSLYDLLSSSIRTELVSLLEVMFDQKFKSSKLEKKMDELLYMIRVSSPFPADFNPEKLPKSEEYRQFLSLYSENMELVQEVVKLKSRVSLLLDSQKLLDKSYASKMAHIDYQIISLGRVISNWAEARREEVGPIYMNQFSKLEELIHIITEKEERFSKLTRMMKVNPESFMYNGLNKSLATQMEQLDSLLLSKK